VRARVRARGGVIMRRAHRRARPRRGSARESDCTNTSARGESTMRAASIRARYPYTSVHYCDSSLRQYWPKGFRCDCLPTNTRTRDVRPGSHADVPVRSPAPIDSPLLPSPLVSPLPPLPPFPSPGVLLVVCSALHERSASFERFENGHIRFHDSLE